MVPDDESAEKAIRTQMRLAYVRYRSELAKHYRSFDTHEEALLHPSSRIRNKNDWADLCNFFNTNAAFKVIRKHWSCVFRYLLVACKSDFDWFFLSNW